MMNQAHIAKLRRDTQSFVDNESRNGKRVKMSTISKHIVDIGWNMADKEMFKEWVQKNITGPIDFQA